MTTLVIDASALLFVLLGSSIEHRTLRRRLTTEVCHAPHLIDAEVGNVLRRQVLRGELSPADAEQLLVAAGPLIDHRHDMTESLGLSAWALRENLTFDDALYAALANLVSAPLVTADARLARSPGLPCTVELIGST